MTSDGQLSFAEHVRELRGRFMWSLLFVVVGAGIGYGLHDHLLTILQRPLHDTLYYSNPTGAFSFIVKICVVFGLIIALPVAIYQTFAFFGPLIKSKTRKEFVGYVVTSLLLAVAGICFAYFVSLPAALNFLVNFGADKGDIKALITADEYFNFVLTYIAGFAVLFQLPLIIAFINRVKPMQPKKLIGHTRYVILGSFVVSAIITPTPDPFNQLIMAGPIILLYFGSVCMVAIINNRTRRRDRKLHNLTPHIEPKTIDAILASLPTQPKPATDISFAKPDVLVTKQPAVAHAAMPARPRLMQDMVMPRSMAPPVARQERQVRRSMQMQVSARQADFRPTSRLISDFVVAK